MEVGGVESMERWEGWEGGEDRQYDVDKVSMTSRTYHRGTVTDDCRPPLSLASPLSSPHIPAVGLLDRQLVNVQAPIDGGMVGTWMGRS